MSPRLLATVFVFFIAFVALISGWFAFNLALFKNETPPEPDLTVSAPAPYALVSLPLTVSGRARVFENVLSFTVTDSADRLLAHGFANVFSEPGALGDFSFVINSLYREPVDEHLLLKVFWESPSDGSPQSVVVIPLTFDASRHRLVSVYLNGPATADDCRTVYPVSRYLPLSRTPAAQSLALLLNLNLTKAEVDAGYFTSLPAGTRLNGIALRGDTVQADFNDALYEVGGSCRVLAIRSQIEATLREFFPFNPIVISINGDSEGALQP